MKKRHLTSLGTGIVLTGLLPGLGCQDDARPMVDDQLGVVLDGLGANIASCTDADLAYTSGSKALTLTLGSTDDAVISVVSNKLKVNGHQCYADDDAATPVELTNSNVNRLTVVGASGGTNKVVLDLLPGTFGNIFSQTTGGIIIDVNSSTMTVGVRGSTANNNIKMAEDASDDEYLELSGNTYADVKVDGNAAAYVISLGDGNDSFNAQDATTLSVAHLDSSVTTVTAVGAEALTVYGGNGNDTLEGGDGNDTLYGGDGNDTFQTANHDDGSDVYWGGVGTDTVDYSERTNVVSGRIDPNRTAAWLEGVNLYNVTVAAADTFTYTLGGSGDASSSTITFVTEADTIAEILSALNTGFGASGVTASVSDRGNLVLVHDTADEELAIVDDTDADLFSDGTPSNDGTAAAILDDYDGESGERDDIKSDVENLEGGSSNDTLTGSTASNTIDGNGGNDDISGGLPGSSCSTDVDVLNGGAGNDVFRMGTASNCSDTVNGNDDSDSVDYQMRTTALAVDLDGTSDDGAASEQDNVKTGVEVILGGEGNDTITGASGDEALHGGLGDDVLTGGTGADTLIGGPGADTMNGGAGNDTFDEASATDSAYVMTLVSYTGADVINGGADYDDCLYNRAGTTAMTFTLCYAASTTSGAGCSSSANDGPENDDITNCDHLVLGGGDDTVTGSSGDDTIEGGGGADSLLGGAGNDSLFGDAGNDTLFGEAGEDLLNGGDGDDDLDGGSGDGDVCIAPGAGTVTTCEVQ